MSYRMDKLMSDTYTDTQIQGHTEAGKTGLG